MDGPGPTAITETYVIHRMPIPAGKNRPFRRLGLVDPSVDRRKNVITARHRQAAAFAEIILNINQ
jgi:hypothetical protein